MSAKRRWLGVLLAATTVVAAGCADQGFVGTLVNPCRHEVEFHWQKVPPGADTSSSQVGLDVVPPLTSRRAVDLPSDFDVLVSVPALGWSERWAAPQAGDQRTFTIPTDLCRDPDDGD